MAHRIEMECVSCALCAEICPAHCIIEDVDTFLIDGPACTDCGDCVPVCPVDCIVGTRVSESTATIEACMSQVFEPSQSESVDPEETPSDDS